MKSILIIVMMSNIPIDQLYNLKSTERIELLEYWMGELFDNSKGMKQLPTDQFDKICALLSLCLETGVSDNFVPFMNKELLDLIVIKCSK